MNAKITLAMLMCGIGAAAAAGMASAATPDSDVPTITVKYDPASLDSNYGARVLYTRLANAAAEVCPNYGDPHWISHQVQVCRERALEGAVAKVHNPRVAAIYLSSTKHG
jgi:UrcA family protein